MGRYLVILSLCLASCTVKPDTAPYVRRGRVLRAAPYVVKLESPLGSGTGFQIKLPDGRRYLLTARHVCDSAMLGLLFVDGRPLRVLKKSTAYDLCLVQPLRRSGGLELAKRAPRFHDNAWTLGYPGGIPFAQYYEGHFAGQFDVGDGLMADAYSFPAAGGQSGSPILDEQGRVVGLLAWRFELTGTAIAVRWAQIREFVR